MPNTAIQTHTNKSIPFIIWRTIWLIMTILVLQAGAKGSAKTPPAIDWLTVEQETRMDASRPIIWEKGIGQDVMKDFVYLPGGGMIAVGATSSSPDGPSFIVYSRFDIRGNLLWRKTIENHGRSWLMDIEPALNGDYYIAGAAEITKRQNYGYVARINSSGTIIWEKIPTPGDGFQASFAKATSDGGVIVGSSIYTKFVEGKHFDPASHKDLAAARKAHRFMTPYLEKLDSTGNTEWTKTIILKDGATNNHVKSLALTPDGGYILLATSSDKTIPAAYSSLVKLGSDGQTIWLQKLPNFDHNQQHSMAVLANGNIAVAGDVEVQLKDSERGAFAGRGRVQVYGSDGTLLQEATFPRLHTSANTIMPALDGHFYMVGSQQSHAKWAAYLVKFKNNGSIVWDKAYTNKALDLRAGAMSLTPSGDIMLLTVSAPESDTEAKNRYFMRVSQNSDITDLDYPALLQKRRLNSTYSVIKAHAPRFSSSKSLDTRCIITVDLDETGMPFNERITSCDVKKKIQKACLKSALKYEYKPAYVNGKPVGVKDVEISFRLVVQ